MTSTIIPTLKCCIDSIQLKLSDFGLEKIDFERILEEKFSTVETPQNVNKSLILLSDNHFEYLNPTCPYCDSNKVIKQEFRERNLIIDDSRPLRIYQRRYKCKNCDHKFTTSLDAVIKPNYRYANIFREKLDLLIKTGYRSLRKACEDFQNFFNVLPSHQTIQNWLRIEQENMIKNVNAPYSGYYCYDEQYVKIKGTWMYRLTLYDHILNIPLAEQIAPDKEYETIKQFLIESTENKQFIGVTTDHVREYKSIMDELGVKHQLCIFHLYKMIANKIYHVSKSKKTSKNEKELLNHYFKEIRNIFNTEKEEIAKTRLEQLLNKFDDIPRVLQKFISKKIIPDFYRLTEFMRDHMMSRTSNPVENYFRQTFPKEIKKKYKTIRGIITYLWRKMQYWTQKHGQHPQHPTT